MNLLILIHYKDKIHKKISKLGSNELYIMENLHMVLWFMCIAMPLWDHNGFGISKSTEKISGNICIC